jgi:rfaE bifunctional protein kinase chain/domain
MTPTKSRISGAGLHTTRQQIVRLDRGGPHPLSPTRRRRLAAAAAAAAVGAQGLVLADYGYGAIEPAAGRRLARQIRQAGKLVAVDSRWRLLQFKGVTTATPNEPELEAAVGASLRGADGAALAAAGGELLRRLDCETLLVTRGRQGMAVFTAGKPAPTLLPVYGTDEVADVTGAGDTVMAVYTVALAAGAAPVDAARLANYAGGLVVMKQGTATVSLEELCSAVEADG